MRTIAVVSGLLTALLLGVVIVWGVDQNKQEEWWSAWGQWVGGVGSIAAAVVAVAIAYLGWKKSDRQAVEQERRLEELAEQDQASKVAVWLEDDGATGLQVMYANNSGLPVHNLLIVVQLSHPSSESTLSYADLRAEEEFNSFRPTSDPLAIESLSDRIGTLINNALMLMHGPNPLLYEKTKMPAITDLVAMKSKPKITASFRDNGNRYWVRFPSGKLRRTTEKMGSTFATMFSLDEDIEKFTKIEVLMEGQSETPSNPQSPPDST